MDASAGERHIGYFLFFSEQILLCWQYESSSTSKIRFNIPLRYLFAHTKQFYFKTQIKHGIAIYFPLSYIIKLFKHWYFLPIVIPFLFMILLFLA